MLAREIMYIKKASMSDGLFNICMRNFLFGFCVIIALLDFTLFCVLMPSVMTLFFFSSSSFAVVFNRFIDLFFNTNSRDFCIIRIVRFYCNLKIEIHLCHIEVTYMKYFTLYID